MIELTNSTFYMLDQGILEGDAGWPFALEEVLLHHVGQTRQPIVHVWRHRNAFIAGLRDRRLPYAAQALEELREHGTATTVRNSGGAAVPLHEHVVNITVIFPKDREVTNVHTDFAWMAEMIASVLEPLGVRFDRGEVTGSYCPGDYDLSIDGRKFCGIAQRRRIDAYSLQAFIIVEGDGEQTGRIARTFYDRATGGRDDLSFPQVEPLRMASLQQLTGGRMTTSLFLQSLHERLQTWGGEDGEHLLKQYETEALEQIRIMRERYDR